MGYKHLDEADRDEIWRLRAEGHNTNEISKRCGRSYATVATFLKGAGGLRPSAPSTSRSALRLSAFEREEISRGLRARETFAEIAARLGRSTSTVSREVGRNGGRRRYRATAASVATAGRTKRPKIPKLLTNIGLRDVVVAKLMLQWSPQQIAGWLRDNHLDDASMYVSPETIYVSLFKQLNGMEGFTKCLRTRRSIRRPHTARQRGKRGKNPNMTPIADRPEDVLTRRIGGHWEGDLVRHEALLNRAVMKGHRLLFVAASS